MEKAVKAAVPAMKAMKAMKKPMKTVQASEESEGSEESSESSVGSIEAPPMKVMKAMKKAPAVMKAPMKKIVVVRMRPPMKAGAARPAGTLVMKAAGQPGAMKSAAALPRGFEWGDWYEAPADRKKYGDAVGAFCSGDVIEFIMRDTRDRERGSVLGEVVGQTIDGETGLPFIHITPWAAEDALVVSWMEVNLASSNLLHLVKNKVKTELFHERGNHVQFVYKWRLRSRGTITAPWANSLRSPGGPLHVGVPRAREPASAPTDAVAPLAQLGMGDGYAPDFEVADPAMRAVDDLRRGLLDESPADVEPSMRPAGTPLPGGPVVPVAVPGMPSGGVPTELPRAPLPRRVHPLHCLPGANLWPGHLLPTRTTSSHAVWHQPCGCVRSFLHALGRSMPSALRSAWSRRTRPTRISRCPRSTPRSWCRSSTASIRRGASAGNHEIETVAGASRAPARTIRRRSRAARMCLFVGPRPLGRRVHVRGATPSRTPITCSSTRRTRSRPSCLGRRARPWSPRRSSTSKRHRCSLLVLGPVGASRADTGHRCGDGTGDSGVLRVPRLRTGRHHDPGGSPLLFADR